MILENQEWQQFRTEIKKQFSTFKELPEYRDRAKHILLDAFDKNGEYSMDVIAVLRLIRESKSERATAVAGMLAFLWEYEGNYMSCIDALCYLLIANGHDLLDVIRRKYVKSLEDIRGVDASAKLNFLKEHNFGLLNREEDKKIRNKIAHHYFMLNDSGRVLINNKSVDVGSRFNELSSFTHRVFETFCSCLNEC